MEVTRRDFLRLIAIAGGVGLGSRALAAALTPERLLEFQPLGNVTLLHMTDPHATLLPVYYREPDTPRNGDQPQKIPPRNFHRPTRSPRCSLPLTLPY
ncbi:MAG: hypothetical protein A3I03_16560 [Candidatus Rokubacteria bacterium RIFCSPLOWO2_02_FULL_68_19]|nr:MAG: hypothetical protein A3I03_16560 [Candidatus Rokubacteria bacterium RIFCSPLOWO2_02_FULL_68_19]